MDSLPSRMVLLRHEPPGRPPHFDWLIERPPPHPSDHSLIAFRTQLRIDEIKPGEPGKPGTPGGPGAPEAEFLAERIADHRTIYLDFEGQLTENRGRITQLAAGACELIEETHDALRLLGIWPSAPVMLITFHGVRANPTANQNNWRFTLRSQT